ncbi:PepSY domain-containing protein [Crocosphaera sp. UHCC 0190]|uniref:PepSY domain-containing protein n=1 Tax=Crocosphaera sp. UHCC 0190 TaxID=3110246 RepID=UPI002B211089|nr:PepSY domain-containing protein [Crocosphaera sp. UHCC 0190]MEA5508404.1 PepSY domain-containing protein [Crocosphaera sp. UHCC 0190]
MKNQTKMTLVIALLGILGIGSLARAVTTTQVKSPVAVISSQHKSYQVAEAAEGDGDGETDDDSQEKQESANLQSLAKISPQQAQQAAEKNLGSQATKVVLENEDGNLVYSVIIGEKDVKVDAGNGKILYTDTPHNEINEKNRPQSSIRVSEDAGGDGDGEMNDDG